MWRSLRRWLKDETRAKYTRIENRCERGTPDLHYCVNGKAGWIEMKEIPDWPRKPLGMLPMSHFTLEQRLWLRTYEQSGGTCWVLLHVKAPREWLLITGGWAARNLHITYRRLVQEAASLHFNVRGTTTLADVARAIGDYL